MPRIKCKKCSEPVVVREPGVYCCRACGATVYYQPESERESAPERARKREPAAASPAASVTAASTVILAACAAGFLLVVLACGGLFFLGVAGQIHDASVAATNQANEAGNAPVSREAFRAAVMGKTEQEVLSAIGKPERTFSGAALYTWDYRRRTIDPVTGNVDGSATLSFEGGRVKSVICH